VAVFVACPVAKAATWGDFTYTTDGATITITGYIGPGGAVNIPDAIADKPVTSIEDSAFSRCTSLTSVTIPNNVASIGDSAFEHCTLLGSVSVGSSVTNIGVEAFCGCSSLTSVTIPDSVTSIGASAFEDCSSLTSVTIADGVTSIGASVFDGCKSLTNVTIPNSVISIGDRSFAYCTSLTGVFFKGNGPTVAGVDQFYGATATVYYRPGTVGWGSRFAGRRAVLWDPLIPVNDPGFGLRANGFGFRITGTTNIPIVLEASTDLVGGAWVWLQTASLTNGFFDFTDPGWTNYAARFYRVRSP
jgi:hypothetical protein